MPRQRILGLIPSLLISVFTLIYLVTGYRTLDEESRYMPMLTAYLTLFLLGLDLIAGWQGKHAGRTAKVEPGVALTNEVRAVLSLIGLVVAIYFFGLYVGGVVYLLLSLRWIGKQSLRFAVITTIITFITIYLLFEKTLSFQLFRGILFSDY